MQVVLRNVSAVIADGIRHIHRPIGASSLDSHIHQFAVLLLIQMFLQIQMQGTAAVQILGHFGAMEHEFVKRLGRILDNIEVAIVTVTWNYEAVLFIPLCVLDTKVFSWDIFCVKHNAIRAICLVLVIDDLEHFVCKINIILVVRRDGVAKEFAALNKAVNANGQELLIQRDISGVVDGEQLCIELVLQNRVPCLEVNMDIFDLFTNGVANITVIVNSSLDQAIHIDGDNTLRTSSHAASTKSITEGVVAHFIAQTTAGGKGVHTIGTIDKEAVSLRKHFGSVVSPFLIDIISTIIQQVQSLYREGEDLLQTLLIQPFHKALL